MRKLEREIMKRSPFLGFYGYWVILTYLSVVAAIVGICFSLWGNTDVAILCLLISGVCDMFDGTVARTAKRNAMEKGFGIQIDSLADIVSFGVHPAMIGYALYINSGAISLQKTLVVGIILSVYVLTALIRLAYFNVTEEVQGKGGKRICYEGLPVTSSAMILPLIYALWGDLPAMPVIYFAVLLAIALAFVLKFRLPKLKLRTICLFCAIGLAAMLISLVLRRPI